MDMYAQSWLQNGGDRMKQCSLVVYFFYNIFILIHKVSHNCDFSQLATFSFMEDLAQMNVFT